MKFRYLLVDEVGDVTGTNSREVAMQAASRDIDTGYQSVVDIEAGAELMGTETYPIQQQTAYNEEALAAKQG